MAYLTDTIQYPFIRKYVDSVGNPRFVSDIYATQQALFDMVKAQYNGCSNSTLAIISGCDLVPGSPNKYSSGYIYFKDSAGVEGIYWVSDLLITESGYATVTSADAGDYVFSDNVSRKIYTFYTAGYSASDPSTGMPVWSGDMNVYRLNVWKTNDVLKTGTKLAQITTATVHYLSAFDTNIDVALSLNTPATVCAIVMKSIANRLFAKIVISSGSSGNITVNIQNSAGNIIKSYNQTGSGAITKYLGIEKFGTNWIQKFNIDYNSGSGLYTPTNENPILY